MNKKDIDIKNFIKNIIGDKKIGDEFIKADKSVLQLTHFIMIVEDPFGRMKSTLYVGAEKTPLHVTYDIDAFARLYHMEHLETQAKWFFYKFNSGYLKGFDIYDIWEKKEK